MMSMFMLVLHKAGGRWFMRLHLLVVVVWFQAYLRGR